MRFPTEACRYILDSTFTKYVRHSDDKFGYINNIAARKDITADIVKYIGKESNNLDYIFILGIDEDSYLEYENIEDFKQWILSLKPKDVRYKGISERELKRQKAKIRKNKLLNPKVKIVKILLQLYKEVELG